MKKLFSLFLFLSFFTVSEAKIILPELLTKQAVTNIRFLSNDGKFTYYQRRSGGLSFSTNYNVKEFLEGPVGTQYTLIGSPARKKIVIMKNDSFHSFYSIRAKQKIYLIDFGETNPRLLGEGGAAQLHLDDTWASYYDFHSKTVYFEHTNNSALKFRIKLNNKKNPYFSPQIIMVDEDTIFYTDLGANGEFGIVKYQKSLNKTEIIFKATTPMVKGEICLQNNLLILGLFGINTSNEGSKISKIQLPFDDFKKRDQIYESKLNDVGQMICDHSTNQIIFIKRYFEANQFSTDILELNVSTKETKPLSELKTTTSIINMDGTLLALDKGKYFIVKGSHDFKNVDTFKSLPPGADTGEVKR